MDGKEAFKNYRIGTGNTIRKFASLTKLSPRIITCYENGEKGINNIPVFKAIEIFDIFNADIEEYFETYYPYKENIDEKIRKWHEKNPHILDYETLKHRMYLRLAKIKKRKTIPDDLLELVFEIYHKNFEILKLKTDKDGKISEQDYMQYVYPINNMIKSGQNHLITESVISQKIYNALQDSEYSIPDVAEICDISRQHLGRCVNGTFDFNKMRIDTALKLCYALNMDFREVFLG